MGIVKFGHHEGEEDEDWGHAEWGKRKAEEHGYRLALLRSLYEQMHRGIMERRDRLRREMDGDE